MISTQTVLSRSLRSILFAAIALGSASVMAGHHEKKEKVGELKDVKKAEKTLKVDEMKSEWGAEKKSEVGEKKAKKMEDKAMELKADTPES